MAPRDDGLLDGMVQLDRAAAHGDASPADPTEPVALPRSCIDWQCQPCSCSPCSRPSSGASGATTPPGSPSKLALPLPHYARRKVSFADQQGSPLTYTKLIPNKEQDAYDALPPPPAIVTWIQNSVSAVLEAPVCVGIRKRAKGSSAEDWDPNDASDELVYRSHPPSVSPWVWSP